ncbi:hypothetical protein B0T20DRAFT_191161 [Sordaria brevicollis]|uniref:Uncharacterized protein n=1 Tax=Sordaria brevicollis TaxID=83679 RepID=A0AAE0PFY6_SORBR|nr:hypothetical protein B0T20DRAFT_191161 [Sordaria brevicollis]
MPLRSTDEQVSALNTSSVFHFSWISCQNHRGFLSVFRSSVLRNADTYTSSPQVKARVSKLTQNLKQGVPTQTLQAEVRYEVCTPTYTTPARYTHTIDLAALLMHDSGKEQSPFRRWSRKNDLEDNLKHLSTYPLASKGGGSRGFRKPLSILRLRHTKATKLRSCTS